MSYIGNEPTSVAFLTDTFSGNGSTTAFTMSAAPATTTSILVAVTGVLQDPSTYSVVGTTLTFSAAPPSGTGNISVRYLGIPASGVTTTAYRTITEFTATAGQTTFTPPSYTPGFINVYRNGVMLGTADYTASNGTTVVLASGALVGDLITTESFYVSSVLNAIPATAGSVGTTYLVDGSVTTAKIATGNITPTQLNTQAQYTGFKNRIINGAMMIDQRNAGASVTPANGAYTLDRWRATLTQSSRYSVQQNAGSVTPPVGFSNYLGTTSLSAYSVVSGDIFCIGQSIEGLNLSDLAWGTANAQTVTLSFWVRSSLTGTFGGSLQNSGSARSYPFTYTISSANTWEQKSITIAGDTSGTWLTTNGIGLTVLFGLGGGSSFSGTAGSWASSDFRTATGATSVVGTNGATFYITGVQLEKGSTATSFDYRPYGTEMGLCQRYYTKTYNDGVAPATITDTGAVSNTAQATSTYLPISPVSLPVEMRATPTVTIFNPVTGSSTASVCIRNVNANTNHAGYVPVSGARYINLSTDNSSITVGNRITAHITASAEL